MFVRIGIALGTIALTGLIGIGVGVGWFVSEASKIVEQE
jgi:hypothetical protein